MTDLFLPDISEFQGTVNWHTLVSSSYPVAIIRAHNGSRADYYWSANRAGAHAAGVQGLGIYQYLQASRDAAAQANALCDLIGTLRPGEWAVCDLEEGTGDQSARAHAWYSTVAGRLHNASSEELYSGDYFYGAHHLSAGGFSRIWLAAYSSTEPSAVHELWQFTDARSFPGISGKTDASVFHGTTAQLLAHVNPPAPKPVPVPTPKPTPTPVPEDDMSAAVVARVDQKQVPKGTAWPGDFLVIGGVLIHIVDPAEEAKLLSQGAMGPMTMGWADYLRLIGK
jgi:GH25 family lysozyme M1 (1,4-beta-N-acetylmuramidase)